MVTSQYEENFCENKHQLSNCESYCLDTAIFKTMGALGMRANRGTVDVEEASRLYIPVFPNFSHLICVAQAVLAMSIFFPDHITHGNISNLQPFWNTVYASSVLLQRYFQDQTLKLGCSRLARMHSPKIWTANSSP